MRLIPYQQTQLEKQSINLLLNMTGKLLNYSVLLTLNSYAMSKFFKSLQIFISEEKSLIKDLNATVLNHLTVQNVAKYFRFFNYYRIMLMIVWTDHDNEVSHINKFFIQKRTLMWGVKFTS